MSFTRFTAFLLASMMLAGGLTACGNLGSNKTSGNSQTSTYTVKIWGNGTAKTEDVNAISKKVSEITQKKLGVSVELTLSSDFDKKNLALTSGEQMDLVIDHGLNLSTLVSTGSVIALDDLLKNHAKETYKAISPADWECTKVNGKIYAVPDNREKGRGAGVAMRKDILDQMGIDYKTIKTYSDIHDVLVKVKQAYPKMYPVVPTWGGGGLQLQFQTDEIGGDNLGVLEDYTTKSTKVVNFYNTKAYTDFVKMMYQWKQDGLLMPDATTTTEGNLIGTVGFADFENIKPGKEMEVKKATGKDIVLIPTITAGSYTSIAGDPGFCIAASSKQPAKAMEVLNLMYTDPEVSTLFVDGIEGQHYQYVDKQNNVIDFPSNVTATTTGYPCLDWAWPNQQITPVWKGAPVDLWKELNTFNKTAVASPAKGFRFDSSNVMNEETACNNVLKKYETPLYWGMLNPDTTLPIFNKELQAAGLNTIIQEKQKQLDNWLKTKK